MKNKLEIGNVTINVDHIVIVEADTKKVNDVEIPVLHVYTPVGQRTFEGDAAKQAAQQLGL